LIFAVLLPVARIRFRATTLNRLPRVCSSGVQFNQEFNIAIDDRPNRVLLVQ
jgi:hypothetical protein